MTKIGNCAYCEKFCTYLTRDHLFPRSRFPPPRYTLYVCPQCNSDKSNRTLTEWYRHLSDLDYRKEYIQRFIDPFSPSFIKWFKQRQIKKSRRLKRQLSQNN